MKFKANRVLFAALSTAALISTTSFAEAPAPTRIRGEIVGMDATTLTVHRRSGDTVKITIKPDQPINALKNIKLTDIKQGSFIGAATKTGVDGKLTAVEVVVFPEEARGTGEGHYAWDLLPGSMMTNANVDTVMQGVNGRTVKLSYKGGSKEVTVPEKVPVVTPIPAARTDLVAGKKVFIVANGSVDKLSASRIFVEKDGVAPPM